MDFWLGLVSNIIGTFVGAGLALLTTFWVVRSGEKKNDVRLIQAVVDRLYRSRALRPGRVPGDYSLESVREDQRRGTKSVLATRDRIALTSDELSTHSNAFDELDAMHLACLRYLNAVEDDPSRYVEALMELRAELEPWLRRLCEVTKGVVWREIGTADLRTRVPGPSA